MTYNQDGIDLIKHFEACRLTAYQDAVGIWTIGYGMTGVLSDGRKIEAGLVIDQAEADKGLVIRLDRFSEPLDKVLTRDVTQNQFNALLSLCYNIGISALERSTLMHYVQEGQRVPAAEEFLRWDKARTEGGAMIVIPGLLVRRKAERELFLKEE